MTTQTALELAERLAAPRQRHVFRVYAEEAAAMLRSQAAEIERIKHLLGWAYGKLVYRSFADMDDCLAMDEIKLVFLEGEQ